MLKEYEARTVIEETERLHNQFKETFKQYGLEQAVEDLIDRIVTTDVIRTRLEEQVLDLLERVVKLENSHG